MSVRKYVGCKLVAAGLLVALPHFAFAAENGNTQYAPGSSGFFAGAIPPIPGVYGLSQTSYYSADRLNDNNGDEIPLGFGLDVAVETLRLVGVTNHEIGGGQVWWQLVAPFVLDLDLSIGPMSDSDASLGDMMFSGGLAWHQGPHTYIFGIDVAAPTGSYDVGNFVNVGLNHWSVQPTVGYHYINFREPTWEFGATARYIKNFENSDTGYTSGDEIVVDYAAGYHVGAFRLGVTGYLLQQVTDDEGPGVASDGHRGRGFAIGPSVAYNFKSGSQLSLNYQNELETRNRAQGDTWQLNFATKF